MKNELKRIEENAKAFLRLLDAKAKDLGITLISLQDGLMVFRDDETGVQVNCSLVKDRQARKDAIDSVEGKASVGEPSLVIGPSKKTIN